MFTKLKGGYLLHNWSHITEAPNHNLPSDLFSIQLGNGLFSYFLAKMREWKHLLLAEISSMPSQSSPHLAIPFASTVKEPLSLGLALDSSAAKESLGWPPPLCVSKRRLFMTRKPLKNYFVLDNFFSSRSLWLCKSLRCLSCASHALTQSLSVKESLTNCHLGVLMQARPCTEPLYNHWPFCKPLLK